MERRITSCLRRYQDGTIDDEIQHRTISRSISLITVLLKYLLCRVYSRAYWTFRNRISAEIFVRCVENVGHNGALMF